MSDHSETNPSKSVWAGIGLGILASVATGLIVAAVRSRHRRDPLTETVDDLRRKAEQILCELSESVALVAQRTEELHSHSECPQA
jgi:gas vesicle protein